MKSTRQTIFDRGVNGVLAKGIRSVINDCCAYRGSSGSKCVIGHCLTDHSIQDNGIFNDMPADAEQVMDGIAQSLKLKSKLSYEDVRFIQKLQEAHDETSENYSYTYAANFYRKIKGIAGIFDLTLDNIKYESFEPTGIHIR